MESFGIFGELPDCPWLSRTSQQFPRESGKLLDLPKKFQRIQKLSLSGCPCQFPGKFPDQLERVHTSSILCEKFPDCLNLVWNIISRHPGILILWICVVKKIIWKSKDPDISVSLISNGPPHVDSFVFFVTHSSNYIAVPLHQSHICGVPHLLRIF